KIERPWRKHANMQM
ncbi:MAG: hypothetical protein COZ67_05455, partial [Chloroflexi bacterium CG_4_8_14_3_um_filter_45_15]